MPPFDTPLGGDVARARTGGQRGARRSGHAQYHSSRVTSLYRTAVAVADNKLTSTTVAYTKAAAAAQASGIAAKTAALLV